MRTDGEAPALHNLTLALAGLAALAVELAVVQPYPFGPMNAAALAVLMAAVVPVNLLLRRRAGRITTGLALFVAAALAVPLVLDPVRLLMVGEGLPLELLMIAVSRDAALALAALSVYPVLLRSAGGLSAALALAASCLVGGPAGLAVLAAYAVVGSVWLSLVYWARVRRDLLPGTGRRPRVATTLAVWGLLMAALALAAAGPRRAAVALAELMPTSGGTERFDPRSRGGSNDGDAAGPGQTNPQTTGMVRTDVFLDSDERTLYDAANDLYGPPRKNKNQQHALALDNVVIRDGPRKPGQNRQASRPFPMGRQGARAGGRPPAQRADAQFFVTGPTPLHLRLIAYDRFDEAELGEEGPPIDRPALERSLGGWLLLPDAARPDWLAGAVRHEVKLAKLETGRLPAPPHLAGFRLERIDQPDFFAWPQEGIPALADGAVPAGTILDIESFTVDPERLRGGEFPEDAPGVAAASWAKRTLGPEVRALALAWAGDRPHGWGQVEAVVGRLRAEYAHDRTAAVPDDRADAVRHFLLESRRGPDFLFAASAASLLRALGHPTRVVWGFYAAPERYDPETDHTPVREEDLHFWAEVRAPGGEWVLVEPTPGYEVLGPSRSWLDRLRRAALAVADWAAGHPIPLGLLLLAAGSLAAGRRRLLDGLATLRWRWQSAGPPRRAVLATLRLLERRLGWAGRPRPGGQTPRRCYARLTGLDGFLELADCAAYAPSGFWAAPPWPDADVRDRCRSVVQVCTLGRLKRTTGTH